MKRHAPIGPALFDGVVESSLNIDHAGDQLLLSRLDKQDCSEILKHNQEMLDAGGSQSGSFGKVELCIPFLVLEKLKRKYPDLKSPDREIRVKAWKRFISTAEARPWKVSRDKYV